MISDLKIYRKQTICAPNPPSGFGSNDSERMRCEGEGAFLQRARWDVREQNNSPTIKRIAAVNIAPDSAPIAESGSTRMAVGIRKYGSVKINREISGPRRSL